MARSKPHFKLHVSVVNHRNTAGLWSDLESRAIYTELGRLAMAKFAGKTEDTFQVNTAELMHATGCKSASAAHRRMAKFMSTQALLATDLGGVPPLSGCQVGSVWQVTFRNYAKKHGMSAKNVKETLPKSKEVREKREEVRKKRKRATPKPLTDETITKLIAMKPDGVTYSPEQVRAWCEVKIAKMKALGMTNINRALTNWFDNVKPGEVAEAVARKENETDYAALDRLKAEMAARPDPVLEFTPEQIEEASRALG